MPQHPTQEYGYTQNRELSWLRFNERVLEEAADPSLPALERLKFISIFCSNLDEFFMVRVGSLFDLNHMTPNDVDNKTGWTPVEQLEHVYRAVPALVAKKKEIYRAVMEELATSGIQDVPMGALTSSEEKFVNRFFQAQMLPILSPILIGPNHPLPHLVNKNLYVTALLEDKKGHKALGIVPLPESVPQLLMLPDGKRYVRTENLLLSLVPRFFDAYRVKESLILAVTRNADLSFDDEKFEDNEKDFKTQMKKLLKKRDHLAIVRAELSAAPSADFCEQLTELIHVTKKQFFVDSCPLDMQYVFSLCDSVPKESRDQLTYATHTPRWPEDLRRDEPMIGQIQARDRLLFYPYDSVDPFLTLLGEAAEHPDVVSIKVTIYRLASSSKIAQTLCRAAENGKKVLVLMELRARFDEVNNLNWSSMLEEAGCQVIYGAEGFKCHSKLCLITIKSRHSVKHITQVGTGNYNEKTNAMYTDLSLMTADETIGNDAVTFFHNMLVNKLDGQYEKLAVSPFGIKKLLLDGIEREAARGEDGYICIKANSVTERDVIDKLMEASQRGVTIDLIIRGINAILPGIQGYTDSIRVTSVVGRFLEHSRVYQFGKGDAATFYISSADLMTRNLTRRVEIACPVEDPALCDKLSWMLTSMLHDTAKASTMLPDGSYARKHGAMPFDVQDYFVHTSAHTPEEGERAHGFGAFWKNLFAKLFAPFRKS